MEEIIQYVTENWGGLVAALFAGFAFATELARLTPTPKDDKAIAGIWGAFQRLFNIGPPPQE